MAVSLVTARRRLGPDTGRYAVVTALSGTTSTFTYHTLQSTILPSDHLAYQWAYAPAAALPRLRRVTETGLNAGTGVVTLDGALGTAVGAGTIVELSARLPPGRDGAANGAETNERGLNECLNMAARQILIEDDSIRIPLVSGQHDYSLAAYRAWLERESRLLDVRQNNALGTTTKSTPKTWSLRRSPSGHYLHFDQPFRFSSGTHNLTLVVLRPVYTLINEMGAAWTEGTTGLDAETDECGADPEDLNTVALAFAYETLRDTSVGSEQAKWAGLAETQRARCRGVPGYFERADQEPAVPSRAVAG